jgi:hypothetical protein
MDVYVSSIVNEIPASDLEPRSGVKERHGRKRRKSERQHAVRSCMHCPTAAELTCD